MYHFVVNIVSEERGPLKFGYIGDHSVYNENDLTPTFNKAVSGRYAITSIEPITKEQFEQYNKSGRYFSNLEGSI